MTGSVPPDLPGYRYLRPVEGGSGGYAEVYVYEQDSPRREVAVKVLKARSVGDAEVRDILDEANAMARLGNHAHIVTVLDARRATDGRPCIIMMYCGGPNLMQLVARGRIDVRRVVRLGIQIADVLNEAHRVHIIHRDIKPANILTDEFGSPRLTDFGIAGRVVPGQDNDDRQFGLSLPWCPPELLNGQSGSVASDIYSLGATLWHLLAGRSPVDVPGHNTRPEIEQRIAHVAAPATGRPDAPPSLELLLAQMLAKRPDDRPLTAAQVGAELTEIERHLGGAPSGPGWYVPAPADPSGAGTGPAAPSGLPAVPGLEKTRRPGRPEPPHEPDPQPEPPPHRALWPVWVAVVVVAALAGGAALFIRPWSGGTRPTASTVDDQAGPDGPCAGCLGDNLPPGPPTVKATRVDTRTVRYTWEYSNARDSDTYRWRADDGREDVTDEPTLDLTVARGTRVCVQVRVVRSDGSHGAVDWSPAGCEAAS